RSEYTERLSRAKAEAAEIVGSATRRATVRSEEILRESSQQAAAMMKKAENTIEQERRKAMNELKDEVASLSVMIASKVVERDVKRPTTSASSKSSSTRWGERRWLIL